MSKLLDAALAFEKAGCSVVPVRADATKAPAAFWKEYQTRRPTPDELRDWFTTGDYDGLGIICGEVSGNVELLEFEGRAIAEGFFEKFRDALNDHGKTGLGDRIADGYAEATPTGGLHLLIRVAGKLRRNTKLASRPARDEELTDQEKKVRENHPGKVFPRVLIETRGEGGFVVTAPSGGRTHPNGKEWRLISGAPDRIATVTPDERDALYAIASLLDQMPAPDPEPATSTPGARSAPKGTAGNSGEGLRPGDDFNERADWEDILTPHGWTYVGDVGGGKAWRRPGKHEGISATTGRNDADNLYVFSSSTEFDTERPYSKFGAWALLEHGEDYGKAAKELRAQGYGSALPPRRTRPTRNRDEDQGDDERDRPEIDITDEPTAIVALADAIEGRAFPGTYVRSGRVVEIAQPSGEVENLVTFAPVTPDRMRRLLAEHTNTYKRKTTKDGEQYIPASPTVSTCAAALTGQHWPGLQPLNGLIHAPVIRPDGTVLQTPGYDEPTGLFLAPTVDVPQVPDKPTLSDIANARKYLVDFVLGDFCFDSPTSRANYVALLMTPMLRLFIGGMVPFGIISAATRGSGKTYLTSVLNAIYGCHMTTWQKDDTETAKVITATMRETSVPVVVFDNVDIHDTVDHPSLAMLLTSRSWSGRVLGASSTFTAPNDRLWLCTGNNVAVGGDISSRSVLVNLDPQMERPELRTGFAIADLDGWLHDDANRGELLRAVLTLARAWVAAGAPRAERPMRNFTAWAEAMGGLCGFLDLPGFLDNEAQLVEGADDEETGTAAFLAQWFTLYGSTPQRSVDLLDSAKPDAIMGQWRDSWNGTFPTRANGGAYSVRGMGKFLAARRNRIFGGLKLVGEMDAHTKIWLYRVVKVAEETATQAAGLVAV